jgi:hypothetical protein
MEGTFVVHVHDRVVGVVFLAAILVNLLQRDKFKSTWVVALMMALQIVSRADVMDF